MGYERTIMASVLSLNSMTESGTILTQRLDSILAFLETSIKEGTVFAKGQAPDVVKELLRWKFITDLFFFIVFSVLFIASVIASWRYGFYYFGLEYSEDWQDVWMGLLFFANFLFGGLTLACQEWFQVLIAPKVYLLEYSASLLAELNNKQ